MVPQPDSMKWTDIYIASRPHYLPRLPDHFHELISRFNLHPNAPFHIRLPMLSEFSRVHKVVLSGTSQVTPGWDGTTPALLNFTGYMFSGCVVTLGRCTRATTAGSRDVTNNFGEAVLGTSFMAVQDGCDLTPKDPSHNCEKDHVKEGTTIQWPLRYSPDLPGRLPRLSPQYLQISLQRSRIYNESAEILEMHLDVVLHVTMEEFMVRPFLHNMLFNKPDSLPQAAQDRKWDT